jgi:hypothetical protein
LLCGILCRCKHNVDIAIVNDQRSFKVFFICYSAIYSYVDSLRQHKSLIIQPPTIDHHFDLTAEESPYEDEVAVPPEATYYTNPYNNFSHQTWAPRVSWNSLLTILILKVCLPFFRSTRPCLCSNRLCIWKNCTTTKQCMTTSLQSRATYIASY